jgi:hypothetical protein
VTTTVAVVATTAAIRIAVRVAAITIAAAEGSIWGG